MDLGILTGKVKLEGLSDMKVTRKLVPSTFTTFLNGFVLTISSSWFMVRRNTGIFLPINWFIFCCIFSRIALESTALVSKITFPLCLQVETLAKPNETKISYSFSFLMTLPPTLIPRRKATKRVIFLQVELSLYFNKCVERR